jgi:hypothetical protein
VQPRDALTLQGGDIRGYYNELGVSLPDWASEEASVSCFADPNAHRNGDRHASCSVNLEHGAWNCHGCGAKGGPYDAAVTLGHSSRSAIDIMARHGLTGRRVRGLDARARGDATRLPSQPVAVRQLFVTERDIHNWQEALTGEPGFIGRLTRERGWLYSTMLELELGFDAGRVTIPVRDEARRLVGLLRYRPWPKPGESKIIASLGSRRQLLPHPLTETSKQLLLVEGEPDMIAARSRGLPAIALPGVETWRSAWAKLFAGREVTIVMDCDREGRRAASRIARDVCDCADPSVLDIAPDRADGYDLTDLLLRYPQSTRLPYQQERPLFPLTVGE